MAVRYSCATESRLFVIASTMNNNAVSGMSLLGLLLALLLATIIASSFSQWLLSYRKNFQRTEEQLTAQEQIRFAAHILRTTITTAGYAGCAKLSDGLQVLNTDDATTLSADNALEIFTASDPRADSFVSGHLLTDSSVIVVRRGDPITSQLRLSLDAGKTMIVENSTLFKVGEWVLLADCRHAELLQIKAVQSWRNQQQLSTTQSTLFSYPVGSTVSPFERIVFYIADSGRLYKGKKVWSLYQKLSGKDRQELVPDITAMTARVQHKLFVIDLIVHNQSLHLVVPLRELH